MKRPVLGRMLHCFKSWYAQGPSRGRILRGNRQGSHYSPRLSCLLISLGPTGLHSQGKSRAGPQGRRLLTHKGKSWKLHSVWALPAGSWGWRGTGGGLGPWRISVRRLMGVPCFLEDKSMALMRFRQFQVCCWVRRRLGKTPDRRNSKNCQTLCVKPMHNFQELFQLFTYKVYPGLCAHTCVSGRGVGGSGFLHSFLHPSTIICETVQYVCNIYVLQGDPIPNPDGTACCVHYTAPPRLWRRGPPSSVPASGSSTGVSLVLCLVRFFCVMRWRSKWQPAKSSSTSLLEELLVINLSMQQSNISLTCTVSANFSR